VDGGLYATGTPGSGGEGYSGGRGGFGNVARPSSDGRHMKDRKDSINEESVVSGPKDGEGFSTGRGGVANVHPVNEPLEKHDEDKSKMARLGLA
jgi:Protein of unknown function (DUF3602)